MYPLCPKQKKGIKTNSENLFDANADYNLENTSLMIPQHGWTGKMKEEEKRGHKRLKTGARRNSQVPNTLVLMPPTYTGAACFSD